MGGRRASRRKFGASRDPEGRRQECRRSLFAARGLPAPPLAQRFPKIVKNYSRKIFLYAVGMNVPSPRHDRTGNTGRKLFLRRRGNPPEGGHPHGRNSQFWRITDDGRVSSRPASLFSKKISTRLRAGHTNVTVTSPDVSTHLPPPVVVSEAEPSLKHRFTRSSNSCSIPRVCVLIKASRCEAPREDGFEVPARGWNLKHSHHPRKLPI